MRGFVLSIISLLMLSFLFALSTSLHDHYLRMERSLTLPQPVTYAAFTAGSAAASLNSVAGPSVSAELGNSSLSIFILDTVPMRNVTGELADYSSLLSGFLANRTHENISADFSDISGGSLEMRIYGRYLYSNSAAGDMLLRSAAPAGATNASAFMLSVSVDKERANLTHFEFNESGDLNLTLHYTDRNGTVTESGRVMSSSNSRFRVDYADGGSLEIGAGRASGSDGSIWVSARNATAQSSIMAILPPPSPDDPPGYEYGASINVSVGGSSVSRHLGT